MNQEPPIKPVLRNGLFVWRIMAKKKKNTKQAEQSIEMKLREIEEAWRKFARPRDFTWVVATFEDEGMIVVNLDDVYFKVTYSESEGEYTFGNQSEWVEVEKEEKWVAKSARMLIQHTGKNCLKAISTDEDTITVANYQVLFGDEKRKDLELEFFTKSTKFDSQYTEAGKLDVDWEHGLGKALDGEGPGPNEFLGFVDWKTAEIDENGVWVERVLDRRAAYMEYIEPLIKEGFIGTSSQCVAGQKKMIKDTGEITEWPLYRDTLTVMPAEHRMMSDNALTAIKSLAKHFPKLKSSFPEVLGEGTGSEPPKEKAEVKTIHKENKPMNEKEKYIAEWCKTVGLDPETLTDEQKKAALKGTEWEEKVTDYDAELAKVREKQDEIGKSITKILGFIENSAPMADAGFISQTGGVSDPNHKSMGDFALAVMRGDSDRIFKIYGSQPSNFAAEDGKAMSQGSGAAGGFLVPPDFEDTLLKMPVMANQIRNQVTVVPVNGPRGSWPALDQFTAPTAGVGDTAYAGGMTAARTAENANLTSTDPNFEEIKWNVEKVGGYTAASNELINDSAESIDMLLNTLFVMTIAAKREFYIMRGTGAGEPLGILNATCAIAVDADASGTWDEGDATEMLSRFQSFMTPGGWWMHPSLIPNLAEFEMGTGWQGFVQNVQTDTIIGKPLFGKPTYLSEHLPQASNAGNVILADMKAYLLFERRGLEIAFSEHVNFIADKGTWRFYQRLDGQPWLSNAITLADPNGSFTMSPFVYNNN